MINLSIGLKNKISAIVIQLDGVVIYKEVKKAKEYEGKHYTEQNLMLFNKALFLLKSVVEQERISYDNICIMEMKCKQVIGWFKTLNAPKNHSELFIETLKIFDSLPFQYKLVNEKIPTALAYTDTKYVEIEKLTTAKDLW